MPACRAAIGTRLWPVMPGEVFTSRNENVPSARRIRSSRPQPRAADDVETRRSDCARIALLRPRRRCRTDRSTSSRRRNTCCGSRSCPAAPRCGSAAARARRGSTPSARCPRRIPRRAPGRRASPRRRYASAQLVVVDRRRPCVMPIVEPSRAGFTISGRPSSATTPHPVGVGVDDAIARRRNAAREPDELGAPLVHRQRGGHHAAAGVRNAAALRARPAPCRPRRSGRAAR